VNRTWSGVTRHILKRHLFHSHLRISERVRTTQQALVVGFLHESRFVLRNTLADSIQSSLSGISTRQRPRSASQLICSCNTQGEGRSSPDDVLLISDQSMFIRRIGIASYNEPSPQASVLQLKGGMIQLDPAQEHELQGTNSIHDNKSTDSGCPCSFRVTFSLSTVIQIPRGDSKNLDVLRNQQQSLADSNCISYCNRFANDC